MSNVSRVPCPQLAVEVNSLTLSTVPCPPLVAVFNSFMSEVARDPCPPSLVKFERWTANPYASVFFRQSSGFL